MGTDGTPHARPTPPSPHPRSASAPALAARAMVVVSLVAIAAVTLQGRQGLDWERLSDVPGVTGAQVLLGVGGVAVLVLAVRQLIRMWRRFKPEPRGDRPPPEGSPMPWVAWLLGGLVVFAGMAACYLVLRLVLSRVPEGGDSGPDPVDDSPIGVQTPDVLPLLLGLLLVLGIGLALTRLLHNTVAPEPPPGPDLDASLNATALAEAVTAAEHAMGSSDDTRTAIIAAYREMARALGRESGRRPSDTPMELLDRAVSAGLVTRGAALELTELFREARFSRHALAPEARRAAEAALARVSAELAVAHA